MDLNIINDKLKEAKEIYELGLKNIVEKQYTNAKDNLYKAAMLNLEIASYIRGIEKAHLLKNVKRIFSKIKFLDAEKY